MAENCEPENKFLQPESKFPNCPVSPPRLPELNVTANFSYQRETVEELFGLLLEALEKSEQETLYWSTMYEESQKELYTIREQMRKDDEADYIDPEAIPAEDRRGSKPSLEQGDLPVTAEEPRWFSLKAAVKSAMSAVVGTPLKSPSYSSLTAKMP